MNGTIFYSLFDELTKIADLDWKDIQVGDSLYQVALDDDSLVVRVKPTLGKTPKIWLSEGILRWLGTKGLKQLEANISLTEKKAEFSIALGKNGLKNSWQTDFPETTICCRCGGDARVGFVIQEVKQNLGETCVHDLHDNLENSKWLHDLCAVAIYFCKKCLETTALYNQG